MSDNDYPYASQGINTPYAVKGITTAEHVALAAEVVSDHSPLPPRVEAFIGELAALIISAVGNPLSDHADKLERLAGLVRE